mmetsp:Transcript_39849/g.70061  ORF Transcript_39849/g.70061 Transcript_39849/m.70061 type:complete len:356 (-) Transcript_39849:44-1111(-)
MQTKKGGEARCSPMFAFFMMVLACYLSARPQKVSMVIDKGHFEAKAFSANGSAMYTGDLQELKNKAVRIFTIVNRANVPVNILAASSTGSYIECDNEVWPAANFDLPKTRATVGGQEVELPAKTKLQVQIDFTLVDATSMDFKVMIANGNYGFQKENEGVIFAAKTTGGFVLKQAVSGIGIGSLVGAAVAAVGSAILAPPAALALGVAAGWGAWAGTGMACDALADAIMDELRTHGDSGVRDRADMLKFLESGNDADDALLNAAEIIKEAPVKATLEQLATNANKAFTEFQITRGSAKLYLKEVNGLFKESITSVGTDSFEFTITGGFRLKEGTTTEIEWLGFAWEERKIEGETA